MPVTIKVNGPCLSLVHKFSNGFSSATIPDVCKTPTPGGPVPIPYPNIAQSVTNSDGTTTVKTDKAMANNKGSKFAISNGDNAGTLGGVKSNVFMKEATWINYSFDVKMDNKNACRLTDPMFHNAENAANMQGESQQPKTPDEFAEAVGEENAKKLCEAACQAKKDKASAADPRASFQRFMRKNLDPKNAMGQRGLTAPFLTEVSQKIANGVGDFIGRMGTTVAGGAPYVRWDVIITAGQSVVSPGTLTWGGVEKIVEVKFPNDTLTPNQSTMLDSMGANGKKVVIMDVDKCCKC